MLSEHPTSILTVVRLDVLRSHCFCCLRLVHARFTLKAYPANVSCAYNGLASFIASSVCKKWHSSIALTGSAMKSWRPWLECLAIAAAFVLPLHRGKAVSRNNTHTIFRRLASTALTCGLAWLPLWAALKEHDDQVPT